MSLHPKGSKDKTSAWPYWVETSSSTALQKSNMIVVGVHLSWCHSSLSLFQWRTTCIDWGISDLSTNMADTNAHIQFVSDLFLHMKEAWNRSIGIYVCFTCLHICGAYPICHMGQKKKNRNWVIWTMKCKCGRDLSTSRLKVVPLYYHGFPSLVGLRSFNFQLFIFNKQNAKSVSSRHFPDKTLVLINIPQIKWNVFSSSGMCSIFLLSHLIFLKVETVCVFVQIHTYAFTDTNVQKLNKQYVLYKSSLTVELAYLMRMHYI